MNITLKGAFENLVSKLSELQLSDDEIVGNIAVIRAFIDNDKGSFDGIPRYDLSMVEVNYTN